MWKKFIFFCFASIVFLVLFAERKKKIFYGLAGVNAYHAIKKMSIGALLVHTPVKKNGWMESLFASRYLKKINPSKAARATIFMYGQFNAAMAIFFLNKGLSKK